MTVEVTKKGKVIPRKGYAEKPPKKSNGNGNGKRKY